MSAAGGALEVADVMCVALARQIADGDVVGVGLGTPLALAACLLARATRAPGSHLLVAGTVDPDADLKTCLAGPRALLGRTAGYVPHFDTMDMAERQAMTMQFLRPAQVDGVGDLNTSRVTGPEGAVRRFPGGLATGDVPSLMRKIVVYLPDHRPRSLPARVAYRTGAGAATARGPYSSSGVVCLVTDLAVFRFLGTQPVTEIPEGRLSGKRSGQVSSARVAELVSVHPGIDAATVRAATGFDYDDGDVAVSGGPTDEERAALERIDPLGLRARELASKPRQSGDVE